MRAARWTLGILAALLLVGALGEPLQAAGEEKKKVLVLGVDGLDPRLLNYHMQRGRLPNIKKLIEQGDFERLHTTMPPLSPIAWSTFITGMDPGGHGIFDFVHREPDTIIPYLSMSKAEGPSRSIEMGNWIVPLGSGNVENLRKGRAFWQVLDEAGVPTTIFRIPANFPPAPSDGKAFAGMGTPDVRGTPGTFSLYADTPPEIDGDLAGGEVYMVNVEDNRIQAKLVGPENPMRRYEERKRWKHPDMTVDFEVFLDPDEPVAKIVVQGTEIVLREGEWSDWVRVDFAAVENVLFSWALPRASAIGRFYLQQVRPEFRLYVTPLQINPEDPVMPLSDPESWSHELYQELGYFYTQELPEDTKAFTHGVFDGREFWEQAQFVYSERRNALDYFLDEFGEGLTFFYFSSVDMGCHMIWHFTDDRHPFHHRDELLKDGMKILYEEIDEVVGAAMKVIDDDTTLIVMSDHGFAPFYWGVNLNSWLVEKGYTVLRKPQEQGRHRFYRNVDWTRTRAYALGLNGLYVNLRGRERNGIVNPGEYQELLDRLERDLLEFKDPRNDKNVVSLVVQTHRDFHGDHLDIGPDIIVGYEWGYRSSWVSPLGSFPRELIVDNDDEWSGDHAMDYRVVPGVLISNKKVTMDQPSLYDLTVAILDEYGVQKLPEMIGRDCLGEVQVEANGVSDTELIGGGGYRGPEQPAIMGVPRDAQEPAAGAAARE
jgi:predicted AlkP superfamily phosphohydrolase/phosphomutase